MRNLCGVRDAKGVKARDLLVQLGPTLRVSIGFDPEYDPERPQRLPDLPAEGVLALIDTGASTSCIDAELAMHLQLPIIDQRQCAGIGGSIPVNMHLAQVHAPSVSFTLYGALAGVDLTVGDQKVLLGRDFLRNFRMIYDGPSGAVDLEDPKQPLPRVIPEE
jgi:hypothetical protein